MGAMEKTMGTVIQFPFERLSRDRPSGRRNESATVIILPIVRTERWSERPQPTPAETAARSRHLPRTRPSE
jgi:hypothetical protein